MQAHTVERVESWDSRPFSGGFRELHDLADADFSGAVVADGTWLFMLNGRVIGVFEGEIGDYEDADGTVYEAPDPSVALLFSMQERGGQTQAKYYSNDTPLSEADDTLSSANFTGYVELSENVLSGDYYVVYYGGRSMSAAFVGTSEDLVTGDDAFERADDEVGVYEVMKTPVNVTKLPEVEEEEDDDAGAAAAGAAGAAAGASADAEPEPDEPLVDDEPSEDATAETPSEPATRGQSSTGDAAAAGAAGAAAGASAASADDETGESGTGAPSTTSAADTGGESPTGESSDGDPPADGDERVFDEEQEWQNARSVPTLDPEKSATSDGGTEAASGSASNAKSQKTQSKRAQRERSKQRKSKRSSKSTQQSANSGKPRSTVEKLKQAVKRRDAKLEETKERIAELESDREELRETVADLRSERDDLETRVDELEAELAAIEAEQPDGDLELDREEALSGTNLFVRYDSKGKPTLDELDGSTNREEVNQNLRIDHHTQFDAERATVDGESFESFLTSTGAYRFVSWAVRELPYEIRDSGHEAGLADLYDAIPDVDRAELAGTVEVETEDGTVTETFDVVLRDRMGEALAVAELNAEREPVTGDEMQSLVDAATGVREGSDELGAAVYVTASFFEPPALETASEETGGGGFLSRSDKESYVNVGRKSGYHLCLVEDRNDAFHLTVPEL